VNCGERLARILGRDMSVELVIKYGIVEIIV
jgi:hypothetical protein